MKTINEGIKTYTEKEMYDARIKMASKTWVYETGIETHGNFSEVFSSKDEKKVHKEEKKNNRNYTCRYRRENGCLVVEHHRFGVWN